jgi:hypothetical protein
MYVHRLKYFFSADWHWNIMDFVVVVIGVIEEIMKLDSSDDAGGFNPTSLRMLRLLKLVRVLRVIRVVKVFRELRLMLMCIAATMRSMFWTLVMLFLAIFVWGIYLTTVVSQYAADGGDDLQLIEDFGSLPRALLTLFQAVTGGLDWRQICDPLSNVNSSSGFVFVIYICFVLLTVMNIMTGVVVGKAMKAQEDDIENLVHEEAGERNKSKKLLRKLMHEADKEKTGNISWSRMEKLLEDPTTRAHFTKLDLEHWDLHTFFDLISQDYDEGGEPEVNIDSFIKTCMRFKGMAKNVEVVALRHEQELNQHLLAEIAMVNQEIGRDVSLLLQEKCKVEDLQLAHHVT